MSYELWRKVRKWAEKKEAESFLDKTCLNLKCPICNTWMSAAENEGRIFSFDHPIACAYECGQCGQNSAWVCEAGFWVQAKTFLGHDVDIPPK